MESDDSPGDGAGAPEGESDHARDRADGAPASGDAPGDADSVRSEDGASVTDQWHSDPPEGWSEDEDGGVFGAGPEDEDEPPPPIEPGSPSLENALFVLLGVLASIGMLLHVIVSL